MSEDPRCCGTGTCIISANGLCWCGQQWDGEKMCFPKPDASIGMNAKAPQAEPTHEAVSPTASGVHNA